MPTLLGERNNAAKLSNEDVRKMRAAWSVGVKVKVLAELFGVSAQQVRNIVKHRSRHFG